MEQHRMEQRPTQVTRTTGTTETQPAGLLSSRYQYLQSAIETYRASLTKTERVGNTAAAVPRVGIYIVLFETLPLVVYDHPAMLSLCDTAFTEGTRVYWSAEFLERLFKEDREQMAEGKQSLLPLFLHEMTHVLYEHSKRNRVTAVEADKQGVLKAVLSSEDLAIQKLAREYVVNATVWHTMAELQNRYGRGFLPGKTISQGVGYNEADAKRFFGLSEVQVEGILREEIDRYRSIIEAMIQSLQDAESDDGDVNQNGNQDGSRRVSTIGMDDEITTVSLARALSQRGAPHLVKEIGLADPDDAAAQASQEARAKDAVVQAAQKTMQIRRDLERLGLDSSSMPGGHVENYVERSLKVNARGSLSFDTAMQAILAGEGSQYQYSDDPAFVDPIAFINPEEMGLTDAPYLGMSVPHQTDRHIAVVLDTSGSMNGLLEPFSREVYGLVQDLAGRVKISLIPADTAVRGDVQELDLWQAQDLQEIRTDGEGGTDLVDVLHQVVDHYRQLGKRLAHIVYLSDLEAIAPTYQTLPAGMPALTFITDSAHADMNFMAAVQDFADVVVFDGAPKEVELSQSPK